MNCYQHADVAATAYCRSCGRGLCADCKRVGLGIVYCDEHLPASAPQPASDWTSGSPSSQAGANPGLAFVLGLIPGVGAIYNGQYAKGLVHAVIFGLLISLTSSGSLDGFEPLFGILIAVFGFYMAFEAYHTARRRMAGQPVDEFSSLFNVRGGSSAAGAITLIVVGVVFLLNTLGVIYLRQLLKFWPVLLIALGVNMLYSRLSSDNEPAPPPREAQHERQ